MRRIFLAGIAFAALSAPVAIHAQDTTSGLSGQVLSDTDAPVAGARVSVVHTPSGTRDIVVTDKGGNFNVRGLRVGGPYTVTVDTKDYPQSVVDGIMLTLGDSFTLPIQLQPKEIVVTAAHLHGSHALITGSQTAFDREQIADIVSARRDVRDIVRRDILSSFNPQTGGVSIAGGNIRTQRFSIDGVQLQDSFGLNYGGLPSARGIVSIEAIEQLTVEAAPFDISEGNFQGGAVNVVLKSGTNRLHITAFGDWGGSGLTGKYTRANQGLVGDSYPVAATSILNFSDFGGSLTGPIIKDKLFFALSYEKLSEGTPNPYGVSGSSAANPVPNLFYNDTPVYGVSPSPLNATDAYPFSAANPTLPGLNTLFSNFTSKYGTFPILDVPAAIAEKDEKYAGKLDWNIVQGQRLTLSYIHHQNTLPNYAGSNSPTQPNISLQSNDYQLTEHTDAESAELNSKWTDNFSTDLRASYKYYRRGQDAYSGSNFAQFNVCMDPTSIQTLGTGPVASETLCQNGTPVVKLGPDTPRQANQFNNHILNLQGNATLTLGTHSIKVEVDHYYSKLYNLFVFGTGGLAGTGGPQGLYYFNSMQDFVNQQANELVYENSTTGAKTDGYVNWAYQINTGGLQDTWKIKPNLTVTAGIRYDRYGADNSIQANQNFATRFQTLYPGLTNTATLDGRDKLQPRFGFNWTPKSNLRISGGIGLFAGGFSDVFVSNNYSNSGTAINGTGATLVGIDLVRTATGCIDRTTGQNPGAAVCNAGLNGVTGSSIPAVVSQYLSTNTGVLANALTNSLDPNFKMPAQWKYNLSANWRPDLTNLGLGKGWTLRGDILFSDAQEAVRWTDLRAQPLVVGGVVQLAPDGRARYGGALNENGTLVQPGANYDMQLTNTTQGQARVFAVGLYKDFKDISFNVDYTHQNVKDVAGTLFSSTVGSAYGSVAALDPNGGGAYGRSAFEVTNEIRAGFEIHHAFFGDNLTTLGFNAEFRSGQPFSIEFGDYTTNNVSGRPNVFGTVQNNFSQLFYVPNFAGAASNPCPTSGKSTFGIVTFADAATCSGVYNLVTQTKLGKYQGQIAPKNVLTGPSYNKVDLHFAQQLPFFHHSKITALFDIENFLNLLNTNWGSYQAYADTAVVRVACTGAAVGGQTCPGYLYSSYSAPKTISYSKFSLYTIRAGVRFDF